MNPDEIEQYLTELGAELTQRGITKPFRFLMIGGAFMLLLANAPRTTDDVDALWLEDWLSSVSQEEVTTLLECVSIVSSKHDIEGDWFNYVRNPVPFQETGLSTVRSVIRGWCKPLPDQLPSRAAGGDVTGEIGTAGCVVPALPSTVQH